MYKFYRQVIWGLCCVVVAVTSASATPPALTAKDTGLYAGTAWGHPDTLIPPGSNGDRLSIMDFTVRNIWNNAGAPDPDLGHIIQEVHNGHAHSPAKTMLVRVHFWDGEDRHTDDPGALLPRQVYRDRVLQSVRRLESVHGLIHGISLSEENVPTAGRTKLLKYLYEEVKKEYPDLPVYQWWTPNTAYPKYYENTWLPADGWVIDPYTFTKKDAYYRERWPHRDQWPDDVYRRLIQKYVITGLPLITTVYASTFAYPQYYDPQTTPWDDGYTMWDLMQHQADTNVAYNLPTSFFWTRDDGGIYFPKQTDGELLHQIGDWVRAHAERVGRLPGGYTGDGAIADYWNNDGEHIISVHARNKHNLIFEEKFQGSEFLDVTEGSGFRDLIVDGEDLRVRGFNGRDADSEIVYHFKASDVFHNPLVAIEATVDRQLNGELIVQMSHNGEDWIEKATEPAAGKQFFNFSTLGESDFTNTSDLWVKIKLRGDAGDFDNPAIRIDHFRLIQNAETSRHTFLNVNFDTGYAIGALHGQNGGINGDAWRADTSHGRFDVVTRGAADQAGVFSRTDGQGEAVLLFDGALDTGYQNLVFSFDFFRQSGDDTGLITLRNSLSSNNTGMGLLLPSGSNQTLRLIVDSIYAPQIPGGATMDTSVVIEDGRWYNIVFQANGQTGLYDVTITPENETSVVLTDIAWRAPNQFVNEFVYLPQGLSESEVYLDNLMVFGQPKLDAIPEPNTIALLGGGLVILMSGSTKDLD